VPAVARREPPPPPSVAPVVAPPPEARPAFVAYEAENARESAAVALDAASAIAADPELVDLLRHGHFVAAIKRYEARHGVGLQQAKAAIDAWKAKSEQREQVAEVVEQVVTDPQIVAAIRKGKLVEAIKLYRAKTGVSLQDAKEAIDTWRRQLGR
jgi:ribosomal protein L7/L12